MDKVKILIIFAVVCIACAWITPVMYLTLKVISFVPIIIAGIVFFLGIRFGWKEKISVNR